MKQGFNSVIRGQHQSLAKSLLADGAYHKGVNMAIRNGLAKTRPGWRKLDISNITGTFKGARFVENGDDSTLVIVQDKEIHLVDLEAASISETLTEAFESDFDKAFICQAEHVLIVQNGEDKPILRIKTVTYDEDGEIEKTEIDVREAAEDEVPTGKYTEYAHGQVVVVTDKAAMQIGNLYVDNTPDSFLKFTDTDYLAGGGSFGLPSNMGEITALAVAGNQGNQAEGPLQVYAENGVVVFTINSPRYLWDEIDLSGILYRGPSAVSDRSLVSSNADILFRGPASLRSLNGTTGDQRGASGLSFRSISDEVKPLLKTDTKESAPFHSMAKADERLVLTVFPDVQKFKGLVSLDLQPAASIVNAQTTTYQKQTSIAYDGLWNGYTILQVLSVRMDGKEEILMLAQGVEGVEFYVLDEDSVNDNGTPIQSRLYTKAYYFEDTEPKRFEYMEVSVSEVKTTTELKAYYRPAGYPLWAELDTHTIAVPSGGLSQPRQSIRFSCEALGVPYNPVTGAKLTNGEAFEFCLQWTGNCQIEHCNLFAEKSTDEINVAKAEAGAVKMVDGENGIALDDMDYEVSP